LAQPRFSGGKAITMTTAVAKKTDDNPTGVGRNPRGSAAADTRVTIRLTDEEHARYTAAADTAGITLGQWLRAAAEAQIKRSGKKVRS
jgi:hypothetical protein